MSTKSSSQRKPSNAQQTSQTSQISQTSQTSQSQTSQTEVAHAKVISERLKKRASQEYVFSWGWFISGVVAFVILCASAYGMRAWNIAHMSDKILLIANNLEETGDTRESLKVLSSFLEAEPDSPKVWARQSELLNQLYITKNFNSLAELRSAISQQKKARAKVSDAESIGILERILDMELELAHFDQSALINAMLDARDIFREHKDNPKAVRVLALGSYLQFQAGALPPAGDPPIDKWLQDALALNPGDIEVSIALANFIISANTNLQQRVTSENLSEMSNAQREAAAMKVIDQMVEYNQDDPNAYIKRFEFRSLNRLLPPVGEDVDNDIKKAIELDPTSPSGLCLAGIQLFQSAVLAKQNGNQELSQKLRGESLEFFEKSILANPKSEISYQKLGDMYFDEKQLDKAVEIWEQGRKALLPSVSEEINGRLTLSAIDAKDYKKTLQLLTELQNYAFQMSVRGASQRDTDKIIRLGKLLTAQMYLAQRNEAITERDAAVKERQDNQKLAPEKITELEETINKKNDSSLVLASNAREVLSDALTNLSERDYSTNGATILSRLEGDSFINLGRLDAENGAWDLASTAFQKAMRYPHTMSVATLLAARAQEQISGPDVSLAFLRKSVSNASNDPATRFAYVSLLYNQEMNKKEPSTRNYDLVESEL
ncbi:MAG: hypothetical protein ACRC2T_20830, partial [Thermoguttaceae bacterium]